VVMAVVRCYRRRPRQPTDRRPLMSAHLRAIMATERWVLAANFKWMAWNLLLAVVPLLLALALFQPGRRRRLWWWAGMLVFVGFLPNAAYVITDAVHIAQETQQVGRPSVILGAVLPLYAVYFAAGLACYAGALVRLRRYLVAEGKAGLALPVEVSLHLLVAVGVFLGRHDRLNSWDVLARPMAVAGAVAHLAQTRPVAIVLAILLVVGTAKAATVWAARMMVASLRWAAVAVGSPGQAMLRTRGEQPTRS
jgi:uncharacterized membrane protein